MSNNIHGLGGDSNNRNNNRNNNSPPLIGGGADGGDPREEGFFTFLKNFICPKFSFSSIIFYLSIADIVIFIATLLYGIKMDPNELLAPKTETLDNFGMKVNYFT